MGRDEVVIARLSALITRAAEVRTLGDPGWAEVKALTAQVATALANITGIESDYYRRILANVDSTRFVVSKAEHIEHGLRALRSDIEAGYLRRTEDLIAGEVFGDFLDMAEHLLEGSFHVPAASLIGAVLEDGLKRLARNHEVVVKPRDDIASIGGRLVAKQVLSNLERKQLDLWAAIRNRADHGQFAEVRPGDVKDMYAGVTRFLAEHLG